MADALGHVVITGAAGGIGRALVHAFHEAGYAVIASDRSPRPEGLVCAQYLQIDVGQTVADEALAAELFARIEGWVGPAGLRGLVNNAATQILGGVGELSRDDWHNTLDVNLLAPFFWTQGLLPALERAAGSVVNVSSIHARLTKRGFVAYATSKAALSGMTRAMAVDLGDRIRINAIEPAAISTPMLRAGFDGKPELYAQLEGCHPQQRIGTPEEAASLAVAMVGGSLRFLHGACIAMDGGIGGRLHDPD